jgi:hypothetical protein
MSAALVLRRRSDGQSRTQKKSELGTTTMAIIPTTVAKLAAFLDSMSYFCTSRLKSRKGYDHGYE